MTVLDYEKLYNSYYLQVYSYVMTIVKSRSVAEEVTQNTFFKAMTARRSYEGKASELTWLCSIAKNLAIDECRKNSEFVERFPELSLFYRLFSPLDSEMICIFPYFCPYAESVREIREIFV